MKRVISFLLVLVFCFSLAVPAFAADFKSSPTGSGPRPSKPDRWWSSIWGDNPKTGDVIMLWVAVLVVSVVALCAVYYIYRRKFAK